MSNSVRPSDDRPFEAPPAGVALRPALPEEVRPAVARVLGMDGMHANDAQVSDFLQYAAGRGIDVTGIWVAVVAGGGGGGIVWSVLPVVSPGRTMLLLAPAIPLDPAPNAAAMALVDLICRNYATRNIHLAQALLESTDQEARRFFGRCGFAEMAELIYLQTLVHRASAKPKVPDGFTLHPYSPATHELFKRGVALSYERSLDCPALNGLREVDDVLLGHKATGEFDPNLWWVLCEGDASRGEVEPGGVLLLSRMPRSDVTELVYLGLTPAARGRGLGDFLMRHALAAVARDGRRRLTLAVDSINRPAMQLYYRHGLSRVAAKVALIRDLRGNAE